MEIKGTQLRYDFNRFQESRHHDVIDTQWIHSEWATNIHWWTWKQ